MAVVCRLEPPPEQKYLLVPQFLIVAVEEQAGPTGLDVRSLCQVEPEDLCRAVLLGMGARPQGGATG